MIDNELKNKKCQSSFRHDKNKKYKKIIKCVS